MTTERFMVDDAGTLIDMQTRDTFDYVSDVCGLLNELHEENRNLRESRREIITANNQYRKKLDELDNENEQLKQQIKDLRLGVLDSIHKANEIQCTCNPCVIEECVKRVIE